MSDNKELWAFALLGILTFIVLMTWLVGLILGGSLTYHAPVCVYDWATHVNVCQS